MQNQLPAPDTECPVSDLAQGPVVKEESMARKSAFTGLYSLGGLFFGFVLLFVFAFVELPGLLFPFLHTLVIGWTYLFLRSQGEPKYRLVAFASGGNILTVCLVIFSVFFWGGFDFFTATERLNQWSFQLKFQSELWKEHPSAGREVSNSSGNYTMRFRMHVDLKKNWRRYIGRVTKDEVEEILGKPSFISDTDNISWFDKGLGRSRFFYNLGNDPGMFFCDRYVVVVFDANSLVYTVETVSID